MESKEQSNSDIVQQQQRIQGQRPTIMQAQSMLGDAQSVRQSDVMNLDLTDGQLHLFNQPAQQRQQQHQFRAQNNYDVFNQLNKDGQRTRGGEFHKFCSLHGHPLEFFCLQDNQKICSECAKNQHRTHKFNFINVCADINKEFIGSLKEKIDYLQNSRQELQSKYLREFKHSLRQDVLQLKNDSIHAVEDASIRILAQINKGDMRNVEREMELFQIFIYKQIQNFQQKIKNCMNKVEVSIETDNYLQAITEKEKIENFENELSQMNENIYQKKEYFKLQLQRIKATIDLSTFQQIKERAEQAQRSIELYSKDYRLAVFVPNKKQIVMHDLKYFTTRSFNIQDMDHPFGNFSSILQSKFNGKIYICGGKQRRKLFEFDERNQILIEKAEMFSGRSNHAFVEVLSTGELVAIGGWDGERAMNQVEGFNLQSNTWRHLPKLVEERHSLAACRMGQSYIYAIGGSSAINYGSSLSTIERLNFAAPQFDQVSHWELIFLFGEFCDSKRSQLGCFEYSPNQIMIFGGFLDTELSNMCFLIDVNTFEIQRMNTVMKKNKKFIKFKDFTLKKDPFLYIVDDDNDIHQYDIAKSSWSIIETAKDN